MKTFLVGGAVRDRLLGIQVKDRDWVVVGSTPEEMIGQGFQPVGQNFPVFLHPKTKEEYALARTERKSGHGYAGFTFHTSADVTLKEDLIRRDLTINAMAEDNQGDIFDPYNGQKDITDKKLRHVSPAFQEDPLRILRVARFAARFHHLGFSVAEETNELMKQMVAEGEAGYLVPERVWQETVRALCEVSPEIYFTVLTECNALPVVLPELCESVVSLKVQQGLQLAAKNQAEAEVRLATCFAFDSFSHSDIKAVANRLRLPSNFSELIQLTASSLVTAYEVLGQPTGESLVSLFEKADAFRRPERFMQLLKVAEIYGQVQGKPLVPETIIRAMDILEQCRQLSAREFVEQGYKGREIGEQLRIARTRLVATILSQ